MKIHDVLVTKVAEAVQSIFLQPQDQNPIYADKVIEKNLKNQKKWGARDRRFFAESVYELVRWWRFLWFLKSGEMLVPSPFQINDLKKLWAVMWWWRHQETPEGYLTDREIRELQERLQQKESLPRAIRESIPDVLDQLGFAELGSQWDFILRSLNQSAPVFLRVNTLKTKIEQLQNRLQQEGFASFGVAPDILQLEQRKNIFLSTAFKDGWFEVQDWSSQQVAPLLKVVPGQRVIDACAGAGGKTLHLATLMKNKGRIIAMDLHDWKLQELKSRARRDGIDIIETRVIENQKTIKRLEESADRLLLDVPCSGLGVLRRNPDAKWKISMDEIQRLRGTQQDILRNYSRMVKAGGLMVYATCSILPSENELQVQSFLGSEAGQKFKCLEQKSLTPNLCLGDGFYMALLEKIKV